MANTVIALKKSATPSAAPVSLANGELAINYADGKLFYKHANGTIAAISSGGAGDSFGTVNAAGTLIIADTAGDILTLEAGSGITITGDAINDKITISAIDNISPAFNQANTARDHANAAFLEANSSETIAISAFNKANLANVLAFNTGIGANAFTSATIAGANTAVGAGANAYANLVWSRSNTYADTVGTSANAFMIAVQNGSNTAIGTGANAFASATIAGANTAIGAGANAFASVVGTSANAFTSATIAGANTAVGAGANAYANLVWSRSNTRSDAIGVSANAFTSATIAGANAAVGLGANTYANATFVRLTAASQTITGNVNIVGDLTLSGNTFTIDATRLEVDDPLIYLAANNYSSDIVDIGFIGNYVNATGANVHTGLYREHTDKMYYLFQGYDVEPINNHIGALSNNMTLAVLNADIRTSNLVLGGANAILTIAGVGTAANNFAIATIAGANTAVGVGANAFTSATISGANTAVGAGANSYANLVWSRSNTRSDAIGVSANAFASVTIAGANTAVGAGANAFTSATIAGANTAVGAGANTVGVAAFAKANAALANTSGVSFNGNLNFPTGNVGIGTTSPLLKLDVSGSSTQGIRVISTDTSGSNIAYFTAQHGSGSSLQLRSGVGYTYLLSTSAVPLYMGTNAAIHMTVDATGNVGIGTTTPSSRLEVLGDVPNSLSNLGTGDAATITITNANVGGLNRIAKTLYEIGNLPIASIAGAYTVFNAGGNIGGDLIFSTQHHVGTGVQERMRIDPTGNVLIGRTDSTVGQNVRLDVAGGINASAVLVNGAAIESGISTGKAIAMAIVFG